MGTEPCWPIPDVFGMAGVSLAGGQRRGQGAIQPLQPHPRCGGLGPASALGSVGSPSREGAGLEQQRSQQNPRVQKEMVLVSTWLVVLVDELLLSC